MSDTRKPKTDWERLEIDYRAGVLTLRELGAQYGVTEGAVRKKAKAQNWQRDLSGKIKARADDLVRKEEVRKKVRKDSEYVATENEVVEINAQNSADIQIRQRTDVTRGRNMVMKLFDELEFQTDNMDLMEQLGELLYKPDDKGQDKRYEAYSKSISLPSRISGMKSLADSLKTLVGIEREVYGIGPEEKQSDPITELLKAVDGSTAGLPKR